MKTLKLQFFSCGIFVMCLAWMTTDAQVKDNEFVISGTIKNISPMPSKLYIRYPNTRDSVEVKDGKYEFRGVTNNVEVVSIYSLGAEVIPGMSKTDGCDLLLGKGTINIISDGSIKKSVYSGNGSQAANDYVTATKKTRLAGDTISKILFSQEYKNDAQLQRDVAVRFEKLWKIDMPAEYIAFVEKNPGSPASTFFVLELSKLGGLATSVKVQSLYHLLSSAQQASIKEVFEANLENMKTREDAEKAAMAEHGKMDVGKTAVDFTQNDTEGKPVSLSSFKGKYVLVDFWASWCKPCREENPNLVKAFNTYKNKGFTVLGISLDGTATKAAWLEAIKKDGLNWTQVSDLKGFENAVAKMYGITMIPQNFLIGPDGVIIAANLRGEELEKKLATLFK